MPVVNNSGRRQLGADELQGDLGVEAVVAFVAERDGDDAVGEACAAHPVGGAAGCLDAFTGAAAGTIWVVDAAWCFWEHTDAVVAFGSVRH